VQTYGRWNKSTPWILPDIDVAEGGGWTGTKAMKLAYQSATPAGVLAAIDMAG